MPEESPKRTWQTPKLQERTLSALALNSPQPFGDGNGAGSNCC